MSDRELSLLLQDIISSIEHIFDYTSGLSVEQYLSDIKTKHAVERNFEIIGEASSRVTDAIKEKYSHVEWRIIKDFRNFITHDYFGINDLIVWDTIQLRLAELKQDISIILKDIKNQSE